MKIVNVYLRTLRILWREERRSTISLIFSSIVVGAIITAEPILFGRVIDSLTRQGGLPEILLWWVGLSAFNILFSVYIAVASDRLAHRQRLSLLDQVFERAIALPLSYHSERGSGSVVRAILAGTDQLFHLWLSFLREQLSSLIGICFLVPIALLMDPRMAGMLFVLAFVFVVANFLMVRRTHALQEKVENYHQEVFSRVGDVIGNVTVVQSYARLLHEINALQSVSARLLSAQYPILNWWGMLAVITRLSSAITMVLILVLGAVLVRNGELSIGQVVSFAGFSGLLINRLEQISNFVSQTFSRTPALQNFFKLLDENGAAVDLPLARPLSAPKGEIEFRNVSYSYISGKFSVRNLNLHVRAGETIALVGPSGSGKSTTIALLQRLFDPEHGVITIDGEDIRQFTLSSLRNSIATVFQQSGLFNRSILENIRVGRPEATFEEVQQAAERAQAHAFIVAKPGGYEFVIGERGAALSGGEQQRIAIARAILKNAPILIFDEATSALDNQTEKKIQYAIMNLRAERKTTILIAHRLSTVTAADHILVFDQGLIVERGTFVELRKQQGLFAKLVEMGELAPEKQVR